jgi:hypothetical protein
MRNRPRIWRIRRIRTDQIRVNRVQSVPSVVISPDSDSIDIDLGH